MIHIGLHIIAPFIVALMFFFKRWQIAFLVMLGTMVVDLDHLLATPIYDPERCSIGFHPLHTAFPISVYLVLCFYSRTRWVGLGLMIHMMLDAVDCSPLGSGFVALWESALSFLSMIGLSHG